MGKAPETFRFHLPRSSQPTILPISWGHTPAWLRERGQSTVVVIDDQIQQMNQLSATAELTRRIREPLNVEFVFCPACRAGTPTARNRRWFPAALELLTKQGDSLAAVCLDLMFDGEDDPLDGSGIAFLGELHRHFPGLPVVIFTQARDEEELRDRLAGAGSELDFLSKTSADRVNDLARFLGLHGWLAEPSLGIYSRSRRVGFAGLRQYAARPPRLESGLPMPIRILGASGDGKSRLAGLVARWLQQVRPTVRPGPAIERLDANTLTGRDQDAQMELFGKGPNERGQKVRPDGLHVRGKAQLAQQGILIIEELGNADLNLQRMLLQFVDTGETKPLFRTDEMTAAALGPLDVLCMVTVQPKHLLENRIVEDLASRINRGTTLLLPPLRERPSEILPIFWEQQRSRRRQLDPEWAEPDDINELIQESAQRWLENLVVEHDLSARQLAELVIPYPRPRIGIPQLEDQWRTLRPNIAARLTVTVQPPPPIVPPPLETPPPPTPGERNGDTVVEQIIEVGMIHFPRDRQRLRGRLADVRQAAASLLLAYLEAVAEVACGADDDINITATYELATGTKAPERQQLRSDWADLLLWSEPALRAAIRRSPLLLGLAKDLAKRSKALERLLRGVFEETISQA